MTDKQFTSIMMMISMIMDGCKDLSEAKEKIRILIAQQTGKTDSGETEG